MRGGAAKSARSPLLAAGILLTLLAGIFYLFPPQFLRYLDGKAFDTFLRLNPPDRPSGRVVIVAIDDASLAKYGQWPWPRHRIASLAENLSKLKPSAVAFDHTFAEADRTSLSTLRDELRRDIGLHLTLPDLPPGILDNDRAFADALALGPFILGYQFTFGQNGADAASCVLHPLTVLEHGGNGRENFFTADGAVCNIPQLASKVTSSGFLNVSPDSDGILRRVPLIIAHKGHLYPSLALATALKAEGHQVVGIVNGPTGIDYLKIGEKTIPVDERGQLLINHRGGRNSMPVVSAADVLDGTIDPGALEGKAVILGAIAHGLIDVRSTPLDPVVAGTEIQATVTDNLIEGDPLYTPPWSKALGLFLVIGAGLSATWICHRALPLWSLGLMGITTAAIYASSAWSLWHHNLFLSPILPSTALWLTFIVLIALRTFIAELTVKERNKKLLVTQDALIQSMANMVEKRHHGTGGHIQRTRVYVRLLAQQLKTNPIYAKDLDETTIELFYRLAPMHDIGKVGIPDAVLLKHDRLTPEEYEIMKMHTVYGAETIREAEEIIGEESYLSIAHDFALSHQERWDGSGYPRGLKGLEIPLAGRLMAVADVYDALVSAREYKPPMEHERAVELIVEGKGAMFDPAIVDAFVQINEEFREVAEKFAHL